MIIVPTPWYAVPSFTDVLAPDGRRCNVGLRVSATAVLLAPADGSMPTCAAIDPSSTVPMFVPDGSDAIVVLHQILGAVPIAIIPSW